VIGLRDNPACRALSPDLTCFSLDLGDLGLALARGLVAMLPGQTEDWGRAVQTLWGMTLRLGQSHKVER